MTADLTGIRWARLPSGLLEVYWPSAHGLPSSSGLQRSTARQIGTRDVVWLSNEPDDGNWQAVTWALECDLDTVFRGRPARCLVGGGRGEAIDVAVESCMRATAQMGRAA